MAKVYRFWIKSNVCFRQERETGIQIQHNIWRFIYGAGDNIQEFHSDWFHSFFFLVLNKINWVSTICQALQHHWSQRIPTVNVDKEIADDNSVISTILEVCIRYCGNTGLEESNLVCFLEESTLKMSFKVM